MADDLFDKPEGGGSHAAGKSGLEKSLTGKVGGMPVWLVGLLLAGGLLAFFYIRKRRAGAAATSAASANPSPATDTTDPYPADGTYDDPSNPNSTDSASGITYGNEAYTGTSGTGYPGFQDISAGGSYPVGLPPQGVPGPTTNVQWARLAADYLLGQGNDPSLVNNGLNNFISGKPLTEAEQAIVKLALQTFGEPPEGVTAVIPAPNLAPAPTPTGSGGGTAGKVTVPNVIGQRGAVAKESLQDLGFVVIQSPPTTPKGEETVVTSQAPRGGTHVPHGSPVTTFVKVTSGTATQGGGTPPRAGAA